MILAKIFGTIVLVSVLLSGVNCDEGSKSPVHISEDWKDPFEIGSKHSESPDPTPLPPSISPMINKSPLPDEDLRLLRIVKSFLRSFLTSKHLDEDTLTSKLKLQLSPRELQLLEFYSNNPSTPDISLRDVEDVLHTVFNSAEPVAGTPIPMPSLLDASTFSWHSTEDQWITFIFGLILCLALAFLTGIVSWLKLLFGFITLCSMWKWLHLRKSRQLDKDTACLDEGWFANWVYSSCSQSTKDQLMDATYEVTPMHALIDTLTEIFARPLPVFGDNLGKFFNSFWGNNGFFSTMFGYGFLVLILVLTIPSTIFAFFYFGMPARRRRSEEEFTPRKPRSSDEKIRKLENQVHALTSTISTLREVSLQSMEYNINRKIEEIKNTRETARTSLSVKHLPPVMEDNPPLKKLKSVGHRDHEDDDASSSSLEFKSSSDEGNKESTVTTLSSDLILSPPSNFKNSTEKEAINEKEELIKGDEEAASTEPEHKEKQQLSIKDAKDDIDDDDDDFEVISKSTPPPEANDTQ